jgi:hypothetical protein
MTAITLDETTHQTTARQSKRIPAVALGSVIAAGIVLITSLIGTTWLFSPANPTTRLPALNLSFSHLRALTRAAPAPAEQRAYFSWLCWTLVIGTLTAAVLSVVVRSRLISALVALLSMTALVCTLIAVKGALTWSQLLREVKDMRIGGYLVIFGFLLLLVHGARGFLARAQA